MDGRFLCDFACCFFCLQGRGYKGGAFGRGPAADAVEVNGLGAAGLGDLALEEVGPVTGLGTGSLPYCVEVDEREGNEGLEEIVELVLVAEVGPDLAADGGDGGSRSRRPASSATEDGSERRRVTARARRSLASASSRKA